MKIQGKEKKKEKKLADRNDERLENGCYVTVLIAFYRVSSVSKHQTQLCITEGGLNYKKKLSI